MLWYCNCFDYFMDQNHIIWKYITFLILFIGICNSTCQHGGICADPQLCKCKPGYYGDQCEKGLHFILNFTLDVIKFTLQKSKYYNYVFLISIFQISSGDDLKSLYESNLQLADPLSSIDTWYRIASPYSKACFLKIFIKVYIFFGLRIFIIDVKWFTLY